MASQQQIQEFSQLLNALMSSNNEQRKAAEYHYHHQLEAQPQLIVHLLLTIITTHQENPVLRLFSAVLLRRALEHTIGDWPPSSTEELKTRLFQAWQNELDPKLSQKISHVLAQITFKVEWDGLIPSVVQLANNSAPQYRNSVTVNTNKLLEILSEYSPSDMTTHFQIIGEYLSQFFTSENQEVRMSCAKTVAACIACFEDDNARNAFKGVIQPLLSILHAALQQGDEVDATNLIDHLVTVAQLQPMFFKASFDPVTTAMLSVGNAHDLECSTRTMALEMLVTLSEAAPAMARRSNGFIDRLVEMTMKLMLEVDDDEESWKCQSYANDDFDEDAEAGDEAMERIATGLGGKSVTEVVLTRVQQFLQKPEWKYRRAAVAAVCRLAEGSTKFFTKYLSSVVSFLTTCLQDRSVRVQYEAIQTIGRFAAVFTESCDDLVDSFLPSLAMILQNDQNCSRIRGHAGSALINLLNPDNCSNETLSKYVQPLLEALLVCLQRAPYEVRSPCLVSLGCIAQICPQTFGVFYHQIMPGIKSILTEATAPEFVELRGKAMECAGLIGEAVGCETFAGDALEIMRIFVHAMSMDADKDVTFEYILPACTRIAKALKTQFSEFVPIVFEPLLAGARQEVNFSMEDVDDDEAEGEVTVDEETGVESTIVSFGAGVKKRVSINTHAMQQRTQAARIIYELSAALGILLGPYLLPSLEVLLSMATDRHSNELRSSAALALAKIFPALMRLQKAIAHSSSSTGNIDLQSLFTAIMEKLIQALKIEPDATARSCLAESLRDILTNIYEDREEGEDGVHLKPSSGNVGNVVIISEQTAYDITCGCLLSCAECILRRNNKEEEFAKNAGERYDEEDKGEQFNEEIEEEEDLLTVMIDIFGHLLKLQGEAFMPIFDKLVAPSFSSYLSPEQPQALQIMASCLIDDAIEFGGASAHKYLPSVVKVFFMNSQIEDNTVLRQCSMYGLAVASKVAPSAMMIFVPPLLSCFVSSILRPDAQEEDHVGITENAVFGIGSLLGDLQYRDAVKQQGQTFPLPDLTKLWLSKLPLRLDGMEAKSSLKTVLDLLERKDEIFFPMGEFDLTVCPYLLEILKVFAESSLSFYTAETSGSHSGISEEDNEVVLANQILMARIRRVLLDLQTVSGCSISAFACQLPGHLKDVLSRICQ